MPPLVLRIAPVALAVALALAPAAHADDGVVDHNFGSGGVVTQSLNTTVGHPDHAGFRRLIWQADGKLVGVGFARFGQDTRVLLARYTADGALDRGFSGGLVLTDVPGANRDIARDVLPLPDGRLIVAGTAFGPTRSDVFLARYLGNGALDPTMVNGGIAIDRALQDDTNSFTDARANAAALLPGNRIVVAGGVKASALVSSFLLAIYDLDGHPLSRQSFSPRLPAEANDVIADPDGKIVVAGYASDGFEIARFFVLCRRPHRTNYADFAAMPVRAPARLDRQALRERISAAPLLARSAFVVGWRSRPALVMARVSLPSSASPEAIAWMRSHPMSGETPETRSPFPLGRPCRTR